MAKKQKIVELRIQPRLRGAVASMLSVIARVRGEPESAIAKEWIAAYAVTNQAQEAYRLALVELVKNPTVEDSGDSETAAQIQDLTERIEEMESIQASIKKVVSGQRLTPIETSKVAEWLEIAPAQVGQFVKDYCTKAG